MIDYLIFAPLLVLILAAVPVVRAALRARRRHAVQDGRLAAAGGVLDGKEKVRVHLARADAFPSAGKAFEAEGAGWLIVDAQHIRVFGAFDDGAAVDREFARGEVGLRWHGAAGARGGYWFSLGGAAPYLSADGLSDWNSASATKALYQRIAPAGTPPPPRPVFHLQSNPLSLVATLLLIALLGYAAYDGFLTSYALIGDHDWLTLLALACVPAGLLLYPLFRRARLPPRETLLLPLLFGFAVGLALIPLLSRINLFSGDAEFVEAAYFFDGGGVYKPLQIGTPTITLLNVDEFAAALKPGAEQGFYLRRGSLGLWQVDLDGLRRNVHLWYSGQDKSTPRLRVR